MDKLGDACGDVVQAAGNVQSNPSDSFAKKDLSEKAKEVSEKVNDILLAQLFRFFILSRQNIQKWTKQNL